jgi:hypothetical protein
MPSQLTDTRLSDIRQHVDEFEDDGDCLVKLTAAVSLYYQGTFKENAAGIVQFYQASLEHIAPSVKFFHVDGKNQPKPIKKDTLELLPFWASDAYTDRGLYGLTLESGPEKYSVSDKAFKLYEGLHQGQIKVMLPLEFVTGQPGEFVKLAKRAADGVRLWSGTGGFALNLIPDYPSDLPNRRVGFVGSRFLGIDVEPFGALASSADKGIKGIDWLTLIGDTFLERAGGRDAVRRQVSALDGVAVHELQHGIMIQAGAEPSFGDVNRGERLTLYHELGRVLRPLMIKESDLDVGDRIGGAERSRKWLYRFFA